MVFIRSERSGRSRPPLQKCRKAAPPKNAAKYLPEWFLTRESSTKSFQGFGDAGSFRIKKERSKSGRKMSKTKKKGQRPNNIMKTVKKHKIIQRKRTKTKKKEKKTQRC